MKCTTVRSKLAGYLDDVVESSSRTTERGEMRAHLDSCASCREELPRHKPSRVRIGAASGGVFAIARKFSSITFSVH